MGVRGVLVSLGDSSEAIAKALGKRGIKGRRSACGNCPIANVLKSELTLGWVSVSPEIVNGEAVCTVDTQKTDVESPKSWTAPQPIAQFAIDFDAGKYPNLEAPEPTVG